MSWDPFVQEEIQRLREDQERRAYEAHLRRNPDEDEALTKKILSLRLEGQRNLIAFNEIAAKAQKEESALQDLRREFASTTHHGLYTCRNKAAVFGGFFSAKAMCDPTLAWILRIGAIGISTLFILITIVTLHGAIYLIGICYIALILCYVLLVSACRKVDIGDLRQLNKDKKRLNEQIGFHATRLLAINKEKIRLYHKCASGGSDNDALKCTGFIIKDHLPGNPDSWLYK